MARSRDEELRQKRRKRLIKGILMGGAAVGVPALANTLVSRHARNLPDATWGSGDRFAWRHGDIAYQRLGDGPPVVLVHSFGAGHSSAEWRHAAEVLTGSFEVFAPDLPGWGQSSGAVKDVVPDDEFYVSLLAEFLRDVVAQPAVVVAAGLPAAYAVQVAADRPERVRALGLVAPQGLRHYGDEPDLKDAVVHKLLSLPILGTSALNLFTSRSALAGYLRREVYASPDLVGDALIDLHYTNSHRPGAHRALSAYLSGYLNHGIREVLPKVEAPCWVAWGRRAVSPSVEVADLWLQRLPADPPAELEVFEQAGMLPHAESPDEFGRKLETWILGLPAGA
jgi:pimeloyl-ACP methyl ester carboxylesterase